MKILISECDTTRQRQLRTILTSIGHKSANIETVSDAKGTFGIVKKKKFDVAFICHEIARMDGMSIVKSLKSGTSKYLPIVLFSPNLNKDVLLEGHQIGANGFLSYPFSVDDVETSILTAIKNVRSH